MRSLNVSTALNKYLRANLNFIKIIDEKNMKQFVLKTHDKKKKCTKKIFKNSQKNKTRKKTLKKSTKPIRSSRREARPAEIINIMYL
jgi:hypothetical protein